MVAFFAEAMGTGVLAFVIFALTNAKNSVMQSGFVPPIIGLTVGSLIAVLAPLTQAGFNPGMFEKDSEAMNDCTHGWRSYFLRCRYTARDFGPRIVAFLSGWKTVAFQGWWVYVVAPLVGATMGALLADKVLYADE
jgi:glycerol uptake facilitator protein